MVDGQGSDTDTIVASARAYVHALNKLLVKRAQNRTEGALSLIASASAAGVMMSLRRIRP